MNKEHIEPLTTINTDIPIELKNHLETSAFKAAPEEIKEIIDNMEADNVDGGIFGPLVVHPSRMKTKVSRSLTTWNGLTYSFRNGHNTSSQSVTKDNLNVYNNSKKFNDGNGGDDGMSGLEKRVENLEYQTRKMQETLDDVKDKTNSTYSKLENTVTKVELTQLEMSIKTAIQALPTQNDMKEIMRTVVKEEGLTTETKVENMMNKARNTAIIWCVGTTLTLAGVLFGALKLFL